MMKKMKAEKKKERKEKEEEEALSPKMIRLPRRGRKGGSRK